jgi:hypothetical protein
MNNWQEAKTKTRDVHIHRDGTISHWSHGQGRWIERAIHVPREEIERMKPGDQKRVRRHLGEPELAL